MQNTALQESFTDVAEEDLAAAYDSDVVEMHSAGYPGESLYYNFVNEIDAWARHALASNGFGDF